MCGIVGVIGSRPAAPLLLDALRRLEYRGYDSAGIATLVAGRIERRRAPGKLDRLAERLEQEPLGGVTGIGHTRWATHGVPNETNAHPHVSDGVALVHNGIIENFLSLRAELVAHGHAFATQTDTEVVAHLVSALIRQGMAPREAAAWRSAGCTAPSRWRSCSRARRSCWWSPARAARWRIGYGDGRDVRGLGRPGAGALDRAHPVSRGGRHRLPRPQGCRGHRCAWGGRPSAPIRQTAMSGALIGKGNHRHFMEKEIFEQPAVLGDTLRSFADPATHRIGLPELPFDLADRSAPGRGRLRHRLLCLPGRQVLVREPGRACRSTGTSPASSATATRRWCEGQVGLFVSQSGETADTLAAMRHLRAAGHKALAVVNVPESTRRPRGRRPAAHAGRPGDRRRLDQGVHHPAGDARLPRRRHGPGARAADARARGAS